MTKTTQGETVSEIEENIACISCGRTDLPLHVDYKCPNCSKYGKC